ncbi:heme/hemin ABC transporter substrate-binding protein [Hydrogenophaga sp. BPS33]|uniref:heme/hemin ABC transporter substrate-binding protein n=1 Tax=Hydrogenophaga sp. BPS33 TaxID=2651974 RepID=UPI001320259F|nr:ABC transporter substrate-binding protein [Hydrogenophaga sp. BPS33]QHE88654.1 ABC transporter substrate-binding protein [Hydrogenophaga sp. BPS33]
MTLPLPLSRRRALQGLSALAAASSPLGLLAAGAPRLITVGGGITEVVYALGAQQQLVGTDTTSLYPAAALATPKVGYMRQLSAEGLLALRPDALIAGTDAGPPVVLDQLRSAGVRVELIAADHRWDEVRRKVAAVGRAANREAAARDLQARLDARWQVVGARVQAFKGPAPKVLFVLSHSGSPQVSGEQTAADAVIRFMGARNALSGFKGYRPMTAEAMAQAAPDVILTTTQGIEAIGGEAAFWRRPELALTPVYARHSASNALVHLDALELLGFGPRMPDVVERLHDRVVRA